jgi:putative transposase
MHRLMDWEENQILELFDLWGEIDRSHRKLAHRGSRLGVVFVSPATVRRVLAANKLVLKRPRRPPRGARRPFPEWAQYRKHQIWIYDATHFRGCPGHGVFAVMDLVTRFWICELVSVEQTSTQVQNLFIDALEREGLLDAIEDRLDAVPAADSTFALGDSDGDGDGERVPVLLAVSDNGPQMISHDTRSFMAMIAVAQHFGRPGTPTDQAWIESLFSHLKYDWPHLDRISDPETLRLELANVREQYNTVRLHAGIGYVTPEDEHQGRGPQIRLAREEGLLKAREARIAYHRKVAEAKRRSQT